MQEPEKLPLNDAIFVRLHPSGTSLRRRLKRRAPRPVRKVFSNRARNDASGFLLLEVLISIVIIATTLVVINRAFSSSLRAAALARDYLLASCILGDKIFDIQIEEGFTDTVISDTVELNQKDFFYSMSISPADMPELEDIDIEELSLKKANLSVNWADRSFGTDNVSRLNISTYVWEKEEE